MVDEIRPQEHCEMLGQQTETQEKQKKPPTNYFRVNDGKNQITRTSFGTPKFCETSKAQFIWYQKVAAKVATIVSGLAFEFNNVGGNANMLITHFLKSRTQAPTYTPSIPSQQKFVKYFPDHLPQALQLW